jgi:YVTN family beta-propeller protein
VYVAHLDADSLSRADLPSTAIAMSVGVGSIPSHVAFTPSGTTAYVSNQGSQSVSVVDVATNTQIGTIELPVGADAWNVLVSPDGRRLYVTTNVGMVLVINTAGNAVAGSRTLGIDDAIRGLTLDPTGRVLYLAGRNSGTIYAVDAETLAGTRTLRIGGTPQRMAVSRDGATLYVANEARGLDVVTLATGTVRTIELDGGAYGLALSPDDAQLYVTVPSTGQVHVVDRARGTASAAIAVGGQSRVVAFTRRSDTAVIANEAGWVTFVR